MKILSLILIILLFSSIKSQLPYSWTIGTDPLWTSSDGYLNWNNGCSSLTTNCNGNYSNNSNSYYTSPVINTSCNNASTIIVYFDIIGNSEFSYDFLFLEYSNDGGSTWVNPYGAGVGWTGNFGALTTITLPIITQNPSFIFRFNFYSDYIFTRSGYKITNFNIICNVVLPIELLSFEGSYNSSYKSNNIFWITVSEINNSNFILQRSLDGYDWVDIYNIVGNNNSTFPILYEFSDYDYKNSLNYYRLIQVDFNGVSKVFNPIVIDNRIDIDYKLVKIVNIMGQEVSPFKLENNKLYIYIYDNGYFEKKVISN